MGPFGLYLQAPSVSEGGEGGEGDLFGGSRVLTLDGARGLC